MEGRDFGRYRLDRLIGSGGMGDVYEALDVERDRVVALKLLPELFGASAEFQERFRRESRLAARLRDPHIIPIHDFGEIDNRLYIEMRLVDDGATLASVLRDDGPLPPDRAVRIVRQIARALDAAHDDGLVHRDVKPSNVLVAPHDFVYVVDFGIAHVVGRTAHGLTDSRTTIGTLDYMAPERFVERGSDRRVDVYSLACLLYESLTRRKPFEASLPALVYAHLNADPPRPSDVVARVPSALDEVVRIGMAKAPADRYATAGALADAAETAIATANGATPAGTGRPPSSTARRSPTRPVTASGPVGPAEPVQPAVRAAPEVDEPARAVGPTEPAEPARPEPGLHPPATPAPPAVHRAPPPVPAPPAGLDPRADADARATTVPTPRVGTAPTGRRAVSWRGALVATAAGAVLVLMLSVGAMRTVTPPAASPAPPAAGDPAQGQSGDTISVAAPTVTGSLSTPPTPGFVAVAPDGRYAYVANRTPSAVTVVEPATGRSVASIPMPSPARFIAVSADGTRAYVSCYTDENTVNVVQEIDLRTRSVTATVPVGVQPYALALAPDQRTLWVPSHETASIDIVDTVSDTVTRTVSVAPNPHWIVFGGAKAWAVNHESNLVTVMDSRTADTITTIPVGISPHAAALSPDGTRLAVVNFDGGTVSMIDARADRLVATIPVGRGPQHVSWASDGRHLYTADVYDDTISVIDAGSSQRTSAVPVGRSPTSVVLDRPGGRTALVTALDDSAMNVIDTTR